MLQKTMVVHITIQNNVWIYRKDKCFFSFEKLYTSIGGKKKMKGGKYLQNGQTDNYISIDYSLTENLMGGKIRIQIYSLPI